MFDTSNEYHIADRHLDWLRANGHLFNREAVTSELIIHKDKSVLFWNNEKGKWCAASPTLPTPEGKN